MGRFLIEGEKAIQVDKEEYDLWRSNGFSGSTVCHAPFVSLDVRGSGAVHPCPYSEMNIGHVGMQTLESIWNGPGFGEVRHRFRDYRVKVEECGGCVNFWKEGIPGKSPAIAEFDKIKLARCESPYVPQVLRLNLRAPLSPLDIKTVFRWLPRLAHLNLMVPWPLPADSSFGKLLDQARKHPEGKRPIITLQIQDNIPKANEVPEGIAALHLSLPMTDEILSPHQGVLLKALVRSLQVRGTDLVIEVSVHQGNWFHLRSWLMRAGGLGITLVPLLVPPSEKASLAELDGDALACLHNILERWCSAHSPETFQEPTFFSVQAMLTQIQQWQQEAGGSLSSVSHLSLPGLHHSIVQEEEALEPFLSSLLRIYCDPAIERWLMGLIESPGFAKEARHRRSFRLAALWLACVFDRAEALVYLQGILRNPKTASRLIDEDRNVLTGTIWESWFDSWTEQLNLKSLKPRTRRFRVGLPQHNIPEEPATITVILASYNHQAFIGEAIRSVLAQTRTDFRLLVIDDASQDGTVEEAQKIRDSRICIIRNPENLGHGQSLARALESVGTEYVAFMDTDDLFHPRRLERCLSLLEETPQAAVAATELTVIDHKGRFCSTTNSSTVFDGLKNFHWLRWYEDQACLTKTPEDFLGVLLKGNSLVTCSNLVGRTDFLRRHQEQWKRLQFCIDWQLYLAAALENALCYVPEALLGYRLHQSNQSHCFAETTNWRYYLESNQVVARTINQLFQRSGNADTEGFPSVLIAMADHLTANTTMDWAGVVLGMLLERLALAPRDLNEEVVAKPIQSLIQARDHHRQGLAWLRDEGDGFAEYQRRRGEIPYLRSLRNTHEALQNRHDRLQGEVTGLLCDRANEKKWWRTAEQERDQALADKETEISSLTQWWRTAEQERDQALADKRGLYQEIGELKSKYEGLHAQLEQRIAEPNELLDSFERRVGEFLLNRLNFRPLLRAVEWVKVKMTLSGLYLARWSSAFRGNRPRVLTTVCETFPIYSQTFVHQEISQLAHHGFQIRLVYSSLASKGNLHCQFASLWKSARCLSLHRESHEQDFERYRSRFPEKVERLVHRLCDSSGLTQEKLIRHPNFLQAFSFTRMAEVYRPHYLHSYFFYDRSLMSLVAGYLLDIPRGISCYADHVLKDYELKVVPLHLELCDVVIATSERIKRELLDIAPQADPTRILVKPNAIDTSWFPVLERREPSVGEPFRLVCVSRIEPKKGLLYLVEAIHQLRKRGLNVELHLIGTADKGIQSSQDYKQLLDERISQLGLWGAVHLEGHQNQEGVLRFLGMSQLFIAPFVETEYGDKDGIPTALLEAMATGLPIVATDAGSITEVIDDGRDGLLVSQRDALALANTIENLLHSPCWSRVLGKEAAEKVRRRFEVRICEKIFHERVRSMLESKKRQEMPRGFVGSEFLLKWNTRS